MKRRNVQIVFDRKKRLKDENGLGTVEAYVYLDRRKRKFIAIGKCRKCDFELYQQRSEVKYIVRRCKEVISTLSLMNLEINVENFNTYYYEDEEEQVKASKGPKNLWVRQMNCVI